MIAVVSVILNDQYLKLVNLLFFYISICLLIKFLIKLCFLLQLGSLNQTWRCELSSELPNIFSSGFTYTCTCVRGIYGLIHVPAHLGQIKYSRAVWRCGFLGGLSSTLLLFICLNIFKVIMPSYKLTGLSVVLNLKPKVCCF